MCILVIHIELFTKIKPKQMFTKILPITYWMPIFIEKLNKMSQNTIVHNK